MKDVPDGYLPVSSALGQAASRELLVAPAVADGVVQAVIELGFLGRVDAVDEELMARLSETLGLTVPPAKDRMRLQELLEETQLQSEELQTQQEELRVGNEELEEQGRALKESQATLESQQAELEQTNLQLSTQAEMLERQNDALSEAQATLGERADALERSNRIKSEFLANMSHELRTPLNSTLILAKLLADNKNGNLSAEQVKFAETIASAGNDLLALINDILDLSRLEAGKVDVDAEPLLVARMVDSMQKTFEPMAAQRALRFTATVDANVPPSIVTDAKRLAQILRKPRRQRAQVHRARRGRAARLRARCGQRRLRGARHRRRHRPGAARSGSSKPFARPTAAPSASTAARAWACRSRATWRACSAATSRCRARPMPAASSRCACRARSCRARTRARRR